jgi:hypothetical protein
VEPAPGIESSEAQLILSSLFRFVKWAMSPLAFVSISLGTTLTNEDFRWAQGSYRPVFFAWLFAYAFWANFTRRELLAERLKTRDASTTPKAMKELFMQIQNQSAALPTSWLGRIELLVSGTACIIAWAVPRLGFQILWLTLSHFLFASIWRTLGRRWFPTWAT